MGVGCMSPHAPNVKCVLKKSQGKEGREGEIVRVYIRDHLQFKDIYASVGRRNSLSVDLLSPNLQLLVSTRLIRHPSFRSTPNLNCWTPPPITSLVFYISKKCCQSGQTFLLCTCWSRQTLHTSKTGIELCLTRIRYRRTNLSRCTQISK